MVFIGSKRKTSNSQFSVELLSHRRFLGEKDSRYRDLVQMADPFPNNPGDKLGSLVEADYGKGTWVYVGLNLWRQLPAGTEGAYEILANLISLGKAPKSAGAPPATGRK